MSASAYGARPANPLDADAQARLDEQFTDWQRSLTQDERDYLAFLQSRLETMRTINDAPYPELDNQTRYQKFDAAQKLANTSHVDPKVDPDDVTVSSGQIEQKLDALLSHINNLNLEAEVFAFDHEDREVADLAVALTDIIGDCGKRDGGDGSGDDEKRPMRQRMLMTSPAVFVQTEWLRKFETRKVLKGKKRFLTDEEDYQGYAEELQLVFDGPSSTILHFPNVFLGDMTKFHMEDQPDFFVNVVMDISEFRAKFGKLKMAKFVKPGMAGMVVDQMGRSIFDNKWRLQQIGANQVGVQFYQCKSRDEFQIVANGVMLLPIGFPLSAVTPGGRYNVTKQVFRMISSDFALGKPFVLLGSVQYLSALIDEMLKLFVLKERKSVAPAYTNTSGRVINRKVLSPGRISMGIEPGALTPIAGTESQGISAGEAAVLSKFEELLTKATVSEQFTGQQGKSGMTATESLELQRQAKLSLGLAVFACVMLEKKVKTLVLDLVLARWFEPNDKRVVDVEDARQQLVDAYRSTTRKVSLDKNGQGVREVKVVADSSGIPTSKQIHKEELDAEAANGGKPVRRIYVSAEVSTANVKWFLEINPSEKESSAFHKVSFREMLGDVAALMNFGSRPNAEGLEDEFSKVWKLKRGKIFGDTVSDPATLQALLSGTGGGKAVAAQSQMAPSPVAQIPGAAGGLA